MSCIKQPVDLVKSYNYGKISSFFSTTDGKTDLVKYYKCNILMFKYINNNNFGTNNIEEIRKYLNTNDGDKVSLKKEFDKIKFDKIKFDINNNKKLIEIGDVWNNLMNIARNNSMYDNITNQQKYNRWYESTADSISIYDIESKRYISGWLGKILQVKLKNNASSFSPVSGVKLFIEPAKIDEIASEIAEIWLARTYDNYDMQLPFQSRLVVTNYQFDIKIEYLGGYFISWIRNVNNTFSIEYDWIERKQKDFDTNLFKWNNTYSVLNMDQFPNNDPTYLGKNLISCDYDFPYVGRPDWWRVDLWILYPLLITLQTIVYGSIRLFVGDIVRKQIDDNLNGKDFAELFTICRNKDDTMPKYI
jgi:hypothetical protein